MGIPEIHNIKKGGETMAILSKDDFMKKIQGIVGDDKSDDSIKFIEDMTDTYNYLVGKQGDGEDWKTKYEENDKMWREKYTSRFFDAETNTDPIPTPKIEEKTEEEVRAETVQIKDLFTANKEE